MNQIVLLSKIIATLILVTMGIDHIFTLLIWKVLLGVAEVLVAMVLIYRPIINLINRIASPKA